MHAAASNAASGLFRDQDQVASGAVGGSADVATASMMRSSGLWSTTRSRNTGNAGRHGSTVMLAPSANCAGAAGRWRCRSRTVGPAVDHHRARAADPHGSRGRRRPALAVGDEAVVQHVEQLEERHLLADVGDVVVLETPGGGRRLLAPHPQLQLHSCLSRLLVAALGEVDVVELELLLVELRLRVDAGELTRRRKKSVSLRNALLGLVLHPEVAAAALLTGEAPRYSSSPNSRKSFSSDC